MSAPQHTPGQCRQAIRQRDALLSQLESLVILCGLGWNKGDTYAEIHIDSIREADRFCKRTRTAIAKATKSTP
jgi:hypothetical protein